MGRKTIEIPWENERFCGSRGLMHRAQSQKMSLSCPSVWGGKSLKFFRKMMDSVGPGGGAPRDFAENELKLPLSMGREIIEIP